MSMATVKKVLIAEDEPQLNKMLAEKFSNEGFITYMATDGEEALTLSLKEHPDVILLDILMPKMDGIAMLKKLRDDEWGKTAKVMLLTNLKSSERVLEGVQLGVKEYFVKSDWKLGDLVKKVTEKIGT